MNDQSTEDDHTLTEGEREALCICAELVSVNLSAEDEYVELMCSNHVAAVEQTVAACMARAWDAALRHVWELNDPAYTILADTESIYPLLTLADVEQARRENPYPSTPPAGGEHRG